MFIRTWIWRRPIFITKNIGRQLKNSKGGMLFVTNITLLHVIDIKKSSERWGILVINVHMILFSKEGMDDDAIKKKISWCLTHQGASSQTLHKVDGIFSATYPKIGGHCHQSRLHLHTVMGKLNEIENTSLPSWRTVTGRVILVHFPIIWFS